MELYHFPDDINIDDIILSHLKEKDMLLGLYNEYPLMTVMSISLFFFIIIFLCSITSYLYSKYQHYTIKYKGISVKTTYPFIHYAMLYTGIVAIVGIAYYFMNGHYSIVEDVQANLVRDHQDDIHQSVMIWVYDNDINIHRSCNEYRENRDTILCEGQTLTPFTVIHNDGRKEFIHPTISGNSIWLDKK